MRTVDWYFDFVSPFAYLQTARFKDLPADLDVVFRPVLFAGLLKHWGHKGPAEIPEKRRFTYRYLQWYAGRHAIPFRMPPAHPFNPLDALRLAVGLGSEREVVLQIFQFIWQEGRLIEEHASWAELTDRLHVEGAETLISSPAVKAELRTNTENAASIGIFGVPTFDVDGALFWGVDATDMLLDYLQEPDRFETEEMARVSELPVATERKRQTERK